MSLEVKEELEKMDTSSDNIAADESKMATDSPKKAKKRKSTGPNSAQKKRKLSTTPKNPLMQLNELQPGLTYNVESQSGPPHNPSFEVSVVFKNKKFVGRGNSKQTAKHAAAQAALASFTGTGNAAVKSEPTDFTLDNVENEGINFNKFDDSQMDVTAVKPILPRLVSEADKKNPVMLLNEINPGLSYTLKEENMATPNQRFRIVVEVNGKSYEGTGQSKKLAKAAAARAVLSAVYHVSYNLMSQSLASNGSPDQGLCTFSQEVADQISKSLMSTFNDVMSSNPEFVKWKIIAGIAMTKNVEMSNIQIITIGTGTKCVSGEHISMVGANINDCHAEIISRRCLKDFFYTNLELLLEGEHEESIFVKKESGGYSLKPNIKFHLYISTAPCGDARIFCPHEEGITIVDRHPNRNSRGVLRTKIESGEGTIPVRGKQSIQTWDSILPGQERLLTMSCSDKIASWNVLGLQGALLSYFIDPIYLDSIILGGLFNSNHLQRALFARFESHLKDLPKRFGLHKPKMCATTSPEMRHLSKSPNFSVNWTLGLGRAEVVNATTGKTESGHVSRLSKRSFFQRFLNIYGRLTHVGTYAQPRPPLYVNYKNAVADYREAQKAVSAAFTAAGLGCWVKKPVEQSEFD